MGGGGGVVGGVVGPVGPVAGGGVVGGTVGPVGGVVAGGGVVGGTVGPVGGGVVGGAVGIVGGGVVGQVTTHSLASSSRYIPTGHAQPGVHIPGHSLSGSAQVDSQDPRQGSCFWPGIVHSVIICIK